MFVGNSNKKHSHAHTVMHITVISALSLLGIALFLMLVAIPSQQQPAQLAEINSALVTETDADGDGVEDDFDACPETSAGEAVDFMGCSESDNAPPEFPFPATGTSFSKDNVSVSTDATVTVGDVFLAPEGDMSLFVIGPESGTVNFTVSGLNANTTYYKYTGAHENETQVTSDSTGTASFLEAVSPEGLVVTLLTSPGTHHMNDFALDCVGPEWQKTTDPDFPTRDACRQLLSMGNVVWNIPNVTVIGGLGPGGSGAIIGSSVAHSRRSGTGFTVGGVNDVRLLWLDISNLTINGISKTGAGDIWIDKTDILLTSLGYDGNTTGTAKLTNSNFTAIDFIGFRTFGSGGVELNDNEIDATYGSGVDIQNTQIVNLRRNNISGRSLVFGIRNFSSTINMSVLSEDNMLDGKTGSSSFGLFAAKFSAGQLTLVSFRDTMRRINQDGFSCQNADCTIEDGRFDNGTVIGRGFNQVGTGSISLLRPVVIGASRAISMTNGQARNIDVTNSTVGISCYSNGNCMFDGGNITGAAIAGATGNYAITTWENLVVDGRSRINSNGFRQQPYADVTSINNTIRTGGGTGYSVALGGKLRMSGNNIEVEPRYPTMSGVLLQEPSLLEMNNNTVTAPTALIYTGAAPSPSSPIYHNQFNSNHTGGKFINVSNMTSGIVQATDTAGGRGNIWTACDDSGFAGPNPDDIAIDPYWIDGAPLKAGIDPLEIAGYQALECDQVVLEVEVGETVVLSEDGGPGVPVPGPEKRVISKQEAEIAFQIPVQDSKTAVYLHGGKNKFKGKSPSTLHYRKTANAREYDVESRLGVIEQSAKDSGIITTYDQGEKARLQDMAKRIRQANGQVNESPEKNRYSNITGTVIAAFEDVYESTEFVLESGVDVAIGQSDNREGHKVWEQENSASLLVRTEVRDGTRQRMVEAKRRGPRVPAGEEFIYELGMINADFNSRSKDYFLERNNLNGGEYNYLDVVMLDEVDNLPIASAILKDSDSYDQVFMAASGRIRGGSEIAVLLGDHERGPGALDIRIPDKRRITVKNDFPAGKEHYSAPLALLSSQVSMRAERIGPNEIRFRGGNMLAAECIPLPGGVCPDAALIRAVIGNQSKFALEQELHYFPGDNYRRISLDAIQNKLDFVVANRVYGGNSFTLNTKECVECVIVAESSNLDPLEVVAISPETGTVTTFKKSLLSGNRLRIETSKRQELLALNMKASDELKIYGGATMIVDSRNSQMKGIAYELEAFDGGEGYVELSHDYQGYSEEHAPAGANREFFTIPSQHAMRVALVAGGGQIRGLEMGSLPGVESIHVNIFSGLMNWAMDIPPGTYAHHQLLKTDNENSAITVKNVSAAPIEIINEQTQQVDTIVAAGATETPTGPYNKEFTFGTDLNIVDALQGGLVMYPVGIRCPSSTDPNQPLGKPQHCVLNPAGVEIKVWDVQGMSGKIDDAVLHTSFGHVATCTTDASGKCKLTITGEVISPYITARIIDKEIGATEYEGKAFRLSEDEVSVMFLKSITKHQVTYLPPERVRLLGSFLDIIYPEEVIWGDSIAYYPFIFTSDTEWTVDVCMQVPEGYVVSDPGECVQEFVSGETKAIMFTVDKVGSPPPNFVAEIKATPPGQKQQVVRLHIRGIEVAASRVPTELPPEAEAAERGVPFQSASVERQGGFFCNTFGWFCPSE